MYKDSENSTNDRCAHSFLGTACQNCKQRNANLKALFYVCSTKKSTNSICCRVEFLMTRKCLCTAPFQVRRRGERWCQLGTGALPEDSHCWHEPNQHFTTKRISLTTRQQCSAL